MKRNFLTVLFLLNLSCYISAAEDVLNNLDNNTLCELAILLKHRIYSTEDFYRILASINYNYGQRLSSNDQFIRLRSAVYNLLQKRGLEHQLNPE